jgi:hypothetical protein
MIYYLKVRFVNGFALILAMQFCVAATPQRGKFLSDSSMDMKQKSQNHAGAKQAARLEELKHPVSTAGTHKNLADARIVFDGRQLRNRFLFPVASIGHDGREFQKAFCAFGTPLLVCLRVGFLFGGQNEMKDCSPHEQTFLKHS